MGKHQRRCLSALPGRTWRVALPAVIGAWYIAAGLTAAQQEKRAIALEDLGRLKTVSDPRVSPDGAWVAHVVESIDPEADTRDTDLWMVSWDGAHRLRLTATPDSSERMPRWSPDNRYLAFLTARGAAEERRKGPQVWLLDRAGGEAWQLTALDGGVSEFAWSPDGTRLAVVARPPHPDRDPEKLAGWQRKTAPPIVIDRYRFKLDGEGYLRGLHSYIAIVELASRKVESLTVDRFDEESPAWSPDGRSIAFASNRSDDPDRNMDTNVWTMAAAAGAPIVQMTTYPGMDRGPLVWSPDGRHIAYLQGDEIRDWAYQMFKLALVPAAGGVPRVLTAALDRPVTGDLVRGNAGEAVWTSDSQRLLFTVGDDRVTYLATMPAAGGAVTRLTHGRETLANLSRRTDDTLALLRTTTTSPFEVYAFEGGNLRQLGRHNDDLLDRLQLRPAEEFASRSADGTAVHGLLVRPPGEGPHPTLLLIHGGPNAQDAHSFNFDRQWFAAQGYLVAGVNYRGSAGRGVAFQKAIAGDYGNKEVMDLLGAVDQLVARGLSDPARLGVGGWSYGGMLTDYLIASDTRFKAAVSGAGSGMAFSMWGSDQWAAMWEAEIGLPWKTQERWIRLSYPVLKAERIKTPTLFLHGENDFNLPVIGSEQMYQTLRSLGVETQLVIYPGQPHWPTVPSYQEDRVRRMLAWYNRFLKPDSGRPQVPPGPALEPPSPASSKFPG